MSKKGQFLSFFSKIDPRSLRDSLHHQDRLQWCPWLAWSAVGHSGGPAGRCRGFPYLPLPSRTPAVELSQIAKFLENQDFLEKS